MQPIDKRSRITIAVLLFLFITAIVPAGYGHPDDLWCWQRWAAHIGEHGLVNAYGSGTNYPPLYQYVLWIYGLAAGSDEAIRANIGYLRIFTLAAEYWGLWIVYLWTGKRFDYLIILLGSLLNIAFSYNTVMWGQVDAIFAAFVIAGFFYLDKGQYRLSAVMIVLALNMKLQAIIFIPMWGLMMLAFLQRDRRWKEALVIIPLMFLVQGLLLLPFFFGEGGLQPVWNAVTGLADTYPFISMNAFNMWYWFVPGLKFYDQKDEALFLLNLSYQQAGLILFCLASLAALWPILLYTIRVFIRRNSAGLSREVIWLSAALITLVFFFFNTRMHERYVHAAFIFLTTYAFYHRRFGLYVLFSVAYFLNLERILHWFALKNYETLVFDPRFVAALFAGCIIWAFVLLYQAAKGDPEGGGPLRLRGRP